VTAEATAHYCVNDPTKFCVEHARLAAEHPQFKEAIDEIRKGQMEMNASLQLLAQAAENDRKARDRDYQLLKPMIDFMQNYIAKEQCDEQKNWEAELAARQKNSDIQFQYQQKLIKLIVTAFAKITALAVAGYFGLQLGSIALTGVPL
jgi:hemerythrin-like domain-containing protein